MTEPRGVVTRIAGSWWFLPGFFGALVFAGLHLVLVPRWRDIAGEDARWEPWWLNSAGAMFLVEAGLFVAAIVLALCRSASPWRAAAAMAGGVTASAGAILFLGGPGTIFPVVLLISLALSSIAVFGGTAIVAGPRTVRRWWRATNA